MGKTTRKNVLLVLILFYTVPLTLLWSSDDTAPDFSVLDRGIGKPVRIETLQGGSFQGILKTVAEDRIEIITGDGQILQINLESIEEFTVIAGEVTKETFFQDSASNRLIVMPTGFPMETGEFHVADQEIIAVTVSYGLNEHTSFWAGVSIPGFLFSARYILAPTDHFAISLGSFAGLLWMEEPQAGAVLPYVVASWGEPNNNFTIGASPIMTFDFTSDTPFELSGAVLTLGGKIVLTATSSLIFENWIMWTKRSVFDNSIDPVSHRWDAVPSFLFPAVVFRIAGQRLSWDIGVILPLFINDSEFVYVEGGPDVEDYSYERNTGYWLGGLAEKIIFPLPILSVTYRID